LKQHFTGLPEVEAAAKATLESDPPNPSTKFSEVLGGNIRKFFDLPAGFADKIFPAFHPHWAGLSAFKPQMHYLRNFPGR
jgi:hypothetical protein